MIEGNTIMKTVLALLPLLVMLINTTGIVSINTLNYNTNYITLHIRVLLADGKPLEHAMIIVKPTIYSTHKYINYTDINGSTYLRTEYNPISKTVYLTIKYWIYGELYTGRVDIRNKDIEIRLNYIVLNRTFDIVDEYLKPIIINYYILKYSINDENKTIVKIVNPNHKIIINGSIDHYLIIYNNKTINNYYLTLGFNNSEKTIRLNNSLLRRRFLVIDLYKPKMWIKELNSNVNIIDGFKYYELKAIIYIYDGVNTPNVKFKVDTSLRQKPRINYKYSLLNNDTAVYNVIVRGSTGSNINILRIYFYAIDPSGKELVISKNISLTSSAISKTITSRTLITTTLPIRTTSISSLTTTNTITQYFRPPTKNEGGKGRGYELYYFIGPIIGLLILIYEILHRRELSISYQQAHA